MQTPTKVIPSADGAREEAIAPVTMSAFLDDPRLLDLLARHPTLKSRLKRISDDPPRRQHDDHRSRGNQMSRSGDAHGQPVISPKRRVAHATRLLEKELNSPSSEDNGLAAFAALVAEYGADPHKSAPAESPITP